MKKSILVKQQGHSDCGAACVVSVAAYFGLNVSLRQITQFVGADVGGISLYMLIEAATLLKFDVKGAKIATSSLPDIPLPAVFHLCSEENICHFVVLYKIKKGMAVIMDPVPGKIISVPVTEFIKCWSGAVLLLMPSAGFQKSKKDKLPFRRLWLARFRRRIQTSDDLP